jgi:hypothetical protein
MLVSSGLVPDWSTGVGIEFRDGDILGTSILEQSRGRRRLLSA